MSPRKKRMGRNEALFRQINEHIVDVSRALPNHEQFQILCECARLDCVDKISFTKDGYTAARLGSDTFIVIPEHHDPEIERVLAKEPSFLVVEKVGEARAASLEAQEADQAVRSR